MDRSGVVAIAIGALIILGSIFFALLVYRSKTSKLTAPDEGTRETTLLLDLREIAASATVDPEKGPPAYEINATRPEYMEPENSRPQTEAANGEWSDWATQPFFSPEQ